MDPTTQALDALRLGSDPAAGASQTAADRAKVKELAQQFESLLMTQMLREMRQSMLSDNEKGFGAETMTDAFDDQLGLSLSRSGGLGLTTFLLQAFDRQHIGTGSGSDATAGSTPAAAAAAFAASGIGAAPADVQSPAAAAAAFAASAVGARPVASPIAAATTTGSAPAEATDDIALAEPGGTVTSPFGWRPDPFNGHVKFHAGLDIRSAYGSDVRAAGSGTVAFAGEQSGYGLTVVIDHGDGLQTRYAHLSSLSVHEGDTVESGEVVARSGNSGRSTGPHLHFEVRKDGRAIDPASIKDLAAGADSTAYRSDQ
jgi:murein DD-endopeptidase MepM/ murein hydrolase activator NlpD